MALACACWCFLESETQKAQKVQGDHEGGLCGWDLVISSDLV